MSFTTPLALLLLVVLPLVWFIGWPRQRFRFKRDVASLCLRTAIVVLLVLALAGSRWVRAADRLAVVFLLDTSDSVGTQAREAGLQYIRDALATMGTDDEAGVVLFGGSALVERPMSSLRELGALQSAPPSGNTDLEEAIRLALGMFPADAARRIVVLSDGRQTVGSAESAAELAAATGVEISTVPLQPEAAPEVQVTAVDVPGAINAGQVFDLNLSISSEAATPALITVLESGAIIQQQNVNLRAGANNYTLSLQANGAGFKDYQVQVDPQGEDGFYQNNQLAAFSRVVGEPRVLLISVDPEETRYLKSALEQGGMTVDVVQPEQLPIGIVALAQYESIVLANVPATRLSPQRMRTLQTYVRDLGGGLVAVGGPQTYGPGGYFQTPLEETLPLDSQIKDQKRLPQLTIAYVIDRSGSMGAIGPSGVENIELAKEAIIRSIDFLQPTDRAGVVSFDTSGYWIANLQAVRDRFALQRLVGTLRTGGGTDILAGMNLVAAEIGPDPSVRKHIILLTDGGASPDGLVELAERLNTDMGVTTSVIAIGAGPASFLQTMAEAGGGNYHPVESVEQIPAIFAQETVLATRSYIVEEPFVPSLSATSPIMEGITAAPPLLGYVATAPKQTAEIILRGPEPYQDPLLAAWQYGLGRAVAFTSDATARWGENWVAWADFVRFWGQAVRWTITEGRSANLESRVLMEGDHARLVVDARDDAGGFLNGLNMELSLVNPQAQAQRLALRQVAPGRYEAEFTPEGEGAYIVQVRGQSPTDPAQVYDQTTGWVMSYSAEYDRGGAGDGAALLTRLTELTGGQSLAADAAGVFTHNLAAQAAASPIWPLLLLIALLLLPLDIAVRRLVVTRSDLVRLQAALSRTKVAEASSERLTTLRAARERGRQRAEESATAPVGDLLRARRERTTTEPSPEQPAPPTSGSKPRYTPPPPAAASSSGGAAPDGNVAGQLLKKRKNRESGE